MPSRLRPLTCSRPAVRPESMQPWKLAASASHDVIGRIAPHVNIFLYDIKHTDKDSHLRLTGADNAPILANLAWLLDNGHEVRVRMPLIEGCNAALAEIEARAVFLEKWRHREKLFGCGSFCLTTSLASTNMPSWEKITGLGGTRLLTMSFADSRRHVRRTRHQGRYCQALKI